MKDKLFKWLFKEKFQSLQHLKEVLEERSEMLSSEREKRDYFDKKEESYLETIDKLTAELFRLKNPNDEIMQDLTTKWCLKTLGIPFIDFSNVDDDGLPPHYLEGLTPDERKNWIASLESIYADPKFQTVVSYVINLIGNHTVQKAEDHQMRNGKIGIIGIRTLMSEFMQAHQEFVDSKKPTEKFDPLETMPE